MSATILVLVITDLSNHYRAPPLPSLPIHTPLNASVATAAVTDAAKSASCSFQVELQLPLLLPVCDWVSVCVSVSVSVCVCLPVCVCVLKWACVSFVGVATKRANAANCWSIPCIFLCTWGTYSFFFFFLSFVFESIYIDNIHIW